MKTCERCRKEKPLDEFHANRRSKDGKQGACKACKLAIAVASRLANPDKYRERNTSWRRANPEKQQLINAKWARENPEKVAARNAKRRTQKTAAGGDRTAGEWRDLVERAGNVCLRCGASGELAADHVVPVSLGGHSYISNIQPLCKSCNSSKGDRHSTDYRSPELVAELRAYVAAKYGFSSG